MVVKINENYLKLKSSYLFVEVARREAEFIKNNPEADVIKMGIGDVTKPLVPAVVKAFNDAVDRASLLAQSKDKNIVRVLIEDKSMFIIESLNVEGKTLEEAENLDKESKEK